MNAPQTDTSTTRPTATIEHMEDKANFTPFIEKLRAAMWFSHILALTYRNDRTIPTFTLAYRRRDHDTPARLHFWKKR